VLEGPGTLAFSFLNLLEHKRILSVISQDSDSGYLFSWAGVCVQAARQATQICKGWRPGICRMQTTAETVAKAQRAGLLG